MRCFLLLILLFFAVKVQAGSITLLENDVKQLKAVQIFNFNPRYKNNLREYFEVLKENGINAVFFRVFQNDMDRLHFGVYSDCRSGVYFDTEDACVVQDLLGRVISEARKYDIDVFAWMATRSLSFLKDKYGFSVAYEGGRYVNGYGVNIFHMDVRNHIIRLFKDLAEYDIDGILIQDDFILRYNEGFSKEALHRYKVDTGEKPDPYKLFVNNRNNSDYKRWNRWKTEQLSDFLNELRYEVKRINPGVKFAVNIYYETPSYPSNGMSWYSQSIKRYKKLGFSYYAYMAYHEQISRETGKSFFETLEYINKSINSFLKYGLEEKQIIVKIQVRSFFNNRDRLPEKEINVICNLINNYKNLSYALVPFERISDIPKVCFY